MKKNQLLLNRSKVCSILGISNKQYYDLIETKKLHPLQTHQGHTRIPLAQVMNLKAEMSNQHLSLPYEKFIMALTNFCKTPMKVNSILTDMGYPRAPMEYIERQRNLAAVDDESDLIREESLSDFFRAVGNPEHIAKRSDVRLMVELLTMIQKGEKEIRDTVEAKTGHQYGCDDILRFQEYFFNWKMMDPESITFYMEFMSGREKLLKNVAYQRSDYFIYYALGIDFGGEIAELLERSSLGILYKLNLLIDGQVYSDISASTRDLETMTKIITNLLDAAQTARSRHGKQGEEKSIQEAESLIPESMDRASFFEEEDAIGK